MSIPATINGLPPIHPGELLREIIEDRGMSQAELARVIGVSPMRISHKVRETRPVTADLALSFGRACGPTTDLRMGHQADLDTKQYEEGRVGQRRGGTWSA